MTILLLTILGIAKAAEKCQEHSGRFQSPINIVTSDVRYQEFRPFSLHGHQYLSIGKDTLYAKNTGTTLKLYAKSNHTKAMVEGGPLTVPYEFVEMHFHWGDKVSEKQGSEHIIDGETCPLEVHMVHRNIMDDTVGEALQHSNGIAVLGFKFKVVEGNHSSVNSGLENLASIAQNFLVEAHSKFDKKKKKEMKWKGDINVVNFFPVYLDEYFSYRGSLTTGGCEEAVNWIVFKDPLAITADQLQAFYSLTREDGSPILNNFRAKQPVNDRPVYYHGIDLILSNTITRGSNKLLRDLVLPHNDFVLPFSSCKGSPSPAPAHDGHKERIARRFWNTKTCSSASTTTSISITILLSLSLGWAAL